MNPNPASNAIDYQQTKRQEQTAELQLAYEDSPVRSKKKPIDYSRQFKLSATPTQPEPAVMPTKN